MKQFIKSSVAAALIALSGVANAGLITGENAITVGSGAVSLAQNETYNIFFDLKTAEYGYRTLIDSISAASLMIKLKDTGPDSATNLESYTIKFGDLLIGQSDGIINVPNGNNGASYGPFTISGISLASLSTNGELMLTLKATTGSFQYMSSTLNATVKIAETVVLPGAVPEPMSIALLGLGLAGLAVSRRKT